MWPALIRVRMSHSAWASSARSLMPIRRPSSSTVSATTTRPSSRASSTSSVRYSSPVLGDGLSDCDPRPEPRRVERVQAAVDLVDRELVVGGVLALDDPIDDAGLVADHPPEVAGIDRVDGDQRDRGLVETALLEQLAGAARSRPAGRRRSARAPRRRRRRAPRRRPRPRRRCRAARPGARSRRRRRAPREPRRWPVRSRRGGGRRSRLAPRRRRRRPSAARTARGAASASATSSSFRGRPPARRRRRADRRRYLGVSRGTTPAGRGRPRTDRVRTGSRRVGGVVHVQSRRHRIGRQSGVSNLPAVAATDRCDSRSRHQSRTAARIWSAWSWQWTA